MTRTSPGFRITARRSHACGGASPETVYDLASLTKLFTTTILLKLADEGRLELEGRVLPLLDVPAANGILRESLANATLAGLLTHTAGLPAWYPFYAGSGSLWDRMEQAIAHEEGGERPPMVYSDLGFILAGRLAEQAAERSLPEAAGTQGAWGGWGGSATGREGAQ